MNAATGFGQGGAIHLAIQAIEVAPLVGIHVHAQREAARPRRNHRVNEAVVEKIPRPVKGDFAHREVPLLFRLPVRRQDFVSSFFHNVHEIP